jgi:hypothetical protein
VRARPQREGREELTDDILVPGTMEQLKRREEGSAEEKREGRQRRRDLGREVGAFDEEQSKVGSWEGGPGHALLLIHRPTDIHLSSDLDVVMLQEPVGRVRMRGEQWEG